MNTDTNKTIAGIPAIIKAAAQLHKLGIYKPESPEMEKLETYSRQAIEMCAKNKNPGVKALANYELALRAAGITHRKYRELMDKALVLGPKLDESAVYA